LRISRRVRLRNKGDSIKNKHKQDENDINLCEREYVIKIEALKELFI